MAREKQEGQDTERGIQMVQVLLPFGLDAAAAVQLQRNGTDSFLVVDGGDAKKAAFRLVINRGT